MPGSQRRLSVALLLGSATLLGGAAYAQTGASIWTAYQSTPNTHANIPNNSYAGYRAGEAALPNPSVVNSVTDFGAIGDGTTDCTNAFKAAIKDAAAKGGGAISIPAGDYLCSGIIHLKESGVVLRGAGQSSTTLTFTRPLSQMVGGYTYTTDGGATTNSQWSYTGGSIWVSPPDTFNGRGLPVAVGGEETPRDPADWEQWHSGNNFSGPRLATVSSSANRGSFTLNVDNAGQLQAGKYYLLRWALDTTNYTLWKHIAGNGLMDSFAWSGATRLNGYPYRWPVQIKSISGNTVTLAQPLPINASTTWNVGFEPLGTVVQESGVENLTVKLVGAPTTKGHLQNDGYNGVYFNRTVNSFIRNVTIQDAENGLITRFNKHHTAEGITIKGYVNMHHGTTHVAAADSLVRNLSLTSDVQHGLSTEHLASGNVWSKVNMSYGTFDSHRLMPFDILRTEITMNNEGGPGGANDFGPFVGKNVVHWNVDVNSASPKGGLYVNQPDAHSKGALVGVRGVAQDTTCAWAMVCGDKGNLIADAGTTPSPANLHDAQFNFRKANSSWLHMTAPYDGQIVKPGNVLFKAEGNVVSGRTISKIEFFNGSTLLGSDTTSPYTFTWANVAKGTYTVSAKLTDSAASTINGYPAKITVADVLTVENTDPSVSYSSGWVVEAQAGASGGSWSKNRGIGAWFQHSFTGNQIDLYMGGLSSNNRNYVNIYLDGSLVAQKGYYLKYTDYQTLVWSSGVIANGPHTVKVEVRKRLDTDTQAPTAYFDFFRVVSTGSGSTPTDTPPTVSLTSPSNGASFTAPATISLAATASDDVSVSKVEFFNGSTLLNSDTTSPYAYTWSSVAAGTYSLTAKATDGAGLSTTTSAHTVTVGTTSNAAPSVSFTSPANGATFTAPATISLAATASDDVSVSKVEFFNGSTLLNSDTTSPYAYTWSSVAAGTYSLTAKATDGAGLSTTTSARTVTVTSGGGTPASTLVVDWGGTGMVTSNQILRNAAPSATVSDRDGDGTADDSVVEYAFSTTTPLSPTAGYTGIPFFGGIRGESYNKTAGFEDRGITNNDTSGDTFNVRYQASSTGQQGRFWALVYFDKANFGNGGSTKALSFGASSSLELLNVAAWESLGTARWVVRDGTQFYVSEATLASGTGAKSLTFTSDTSDGNWATYSPSTSLDFNQSSASFTGRNFTNITGVGLLIDKDTYSTARHWLQFRNFKATVIAQ